MASRPSTTPLKVFLDASVIFAAAYSATGGSRELLVSSTLAPRRTLLASEFVIEEARRNLTRKMPESLPVLNELLANLRYTPVPEPSRRLVVRVSSVVVWKDAPVVAGAIRGRAKYLVSLDRRDLLSKSDDIKTSFGVRVVTPGDMLRLLRDG